MNQKDYNENIELIWDFIEAYQALEATFRGYVNDPIDIDKENCFV